MRGLFTLIFFFSTVPAFAGQWEIDKKKSRLAFQAVQAGDIVVEGMLEDFKAHVCFNERDLAETVFSLSFLVNSLTTGVTERDDILRAEEWLDVDQHPRGNFQLTDLKRLGPNRYEAMGMLEIKGIQRNIVFPLTLNLLEERATGALTIDRRDFTIGSGSWGETEKWVKFPITVSFDIFANPTGGQCEQY